MNILLLTAYFPPEIGSAANLYYELAVTFNKLNHNVTVVTSFPREYNISSNENLSLNSNVPLMIENKNKFRIIRCKTFLAPRDVVPLRGLEHFFIGLPLLIATIFSGDHDAIITYSPPLTISFIGCLLSKIKKGAIILSNIQDIYPRALIDIGILSNKILIKLYKIMEKFIYLISDYIIVHSDGNKSFLIKSGVNKHKIKVIYNWVKTYNNINSDEIIFFKKKHGLNDNFIITYAGILSFSQDIETIIECAYILKNINKLKFMIVGDGPKKKKLISRVKDLQLKNILFLPYQSLDNYWRILYSSDVCLVSLSKHTVKTPVVPKKLQDIMAAGRPIIANVPLNSDVVDIVLKSNSGLIVESNNPLQLSKAILKLFNNEELRKSCGYNGLQFAKNNFLAISSANKILELIKK